MPVMMIGVLLGIFGIVDMIGSFANFDVWGIMGITLPEIIWQYTAYIEMAAGYYLFKLGMTMYAVKKSKIVEDAS